MHSLIYSSRQPDIGKGACWHPAVHTSAVSALKYATLSMLGEHVRAEVVYKLEWILLQETLGLYITFKSG